MKDKNIDPHHASKRKFGYAETISEAEKPKTTTKSKKENRHSITSGWLTDAASLSLTGPSFRVPARASLLVLDEAILFVREHAGNVTLVSGEPLVSHATGAVNILHIMDVKAPSTLAAALFAAFPHTSKCERLLADRFGKEVLQLVIGARKLLQVSTVSIQADMPASETSWSIQTRCCAQVEALRKKLVNFSQDIRLVLIRLASRLQTLRFCATYKLTPPSDFLRDIFEIDAWLANRFGIWQMKWELEDLAFRFEDPVTYKRISKLLKARHTERELDVLRAVERLKQVLSSAHIEAEVSGRAKQIYSIWRKMQRKKVDFFQIYDASALRVIVADVQDCYRALDIIHATWQHVPDEFDDYISRPKPNGYRSLHTVTIDSDGRAFEVQIRTCKMHDFAEYGIAAHWRYKEASAHGYGEQFVREGKDNEKNV
ncbi:hypothetical protein EC973_006033 [Apophysomyces ossiformis]|uniref:RelA/SpoT domain-containing protein n=1 Tax=Apophysomyces ossiformis TaxID=679940 RepID=A0A8H7BWD5_9FUNG|nr:hypothetical protein EC973_006033 [Apophysomyces ossiformis]